MDKKAHHELGFAPYAFLIGLLVFIAAYGRKTWRRLFSKKAIQKKK